MVFGARGDGVDGRPDAGAYRSIALGVDQPRAPVEAPGLATTSLVAELLSVS
jgi:hypothetical protein